MENTLIQFLKIGFIAVALITQSSNAVTGPELYPGERALYTAAAKEGTVSSYDTGPEWANWKALFRAFQARYPGIAITYNDLGSAATVVALENEKRKPLADTAYYFAASAAEASKRGLTAPFRPINIGKIDEILRDADGGWFPVHSLTVAFIVNRALVKTVPMSWADLLRPEYKESIVYLNPKSTGVGQAIVFAASHANGGDNEKVDPGVSFLTKLHQSSNVKSVEATSPYAQFVAGKIPIWIGYENDGLKAKLIDKMGDQVAVVIPREASIAAPYAMSLVKGAQHPNAAKLWLNFVMSDIGQKLFAEGFVRPIRPDVVLPREVRQNLPYAPQIRHLSIESAMRLKTYIDDAWTARVSSGTAKQ
jgi:putative spermidine/putrescine transport system substrate-binding protein